MIIFAPKSKGSQKRSDLFLHKNKIAKFVEVPQMGGPSLFEKINVIIKSPTIALKLIRLLISKRNDDAMIHLRPPGNISFISLFVLPFFRNFKKGVDIT